MKQIDDRKEAVELLANIHKELPSLTERLASCSDHWGYDDPIYRFYSQSFKVYRLQETTSEIVAKLQALAPGRNLAEWFVTIIKEGTCKTFTMAHNDNWPAHTRPIVEAFFHTRYFIEMAVKCGKELKFPPQLMPSGWAALLSLYGLR